MENFQKWLQPEDVKNGMEAEWGNGEIAGTVVAIYNTDYLKENPKIYQDIINATSTHNVSLRSILKDVADLSPGWKMLVKTDNHKYLFNWYIDEKDDKDNPPLNVLRVSVNELWKGSGKLKNINDKTGIFENMRSKKYLNANELAVGMTSPIHYQDGSVIVWKIIYLFKNVKEMINEYRKYSHFYKIIKQDNYQKEKFDKIVSTTAIYGSNLHNLDFLPIILVEFKDKYNDMHYQLYLYGKHEINLSGPNGTDTILFEPDENRWRGRKKLNDTNDKTGIFEHIKSFHLFTLGKKNLNDF